MISKHMRVNGVDTLVTILFPSDKRHKSQIGPILQSGIANMFNVSRQLTYSSALVAYIHSDTEVQLLKNRLGLTRNISVQELCDLLGVVSLEEFLLEELL